jgi:dsRNA-specific ribonuclease
MRICLDSGVRKVYHEVSKPDCPLTSTEQALGEWTDIGNLVASNANLSAVGVRFGLHHCINMNPGTTHPSAAIVATMVEALLGAVHLDGGNDALDALVAKLSWDTRLSLIDKTGTQPTIGE